MSIADELALLANTKEGLRASLGLSEDVPFSQYKNHIPHYAKAGTVFDFVNNQYSRDQLPVNLSDISNFIRLSAATVWQEDGSVVEVDVDVPRISVEGLLIEPQRTNSAVGAVNSYFTSSDVNAVNWGQTDGALSDKEDFYRFEKTNKAGTENFYRYRYGTTFPEGIVTGSIFLRRGDSPARYFKLFSAFLTFTNSSFDLDTYTVNASYNPNDTLDARMDKKASIARASHSALKEDLRTTFVIVFADSPVPTSLQSPLTQDGQYHLLSGIQVEDGLYPTSYIHALSAPATRAPDILNIPIKSTQTVTGDWDDGVTYEIADGVLSFTGLGYIRSIILEDVE